MYSVLIVDDEQPVIESISFMLQKYRPEIGIAGTAMSGREAIKAAEEYKPDIILIDVKMPGIDGLEALREIKRRNPNVLPILTTAYERFDIAQTAFELGVQDYILKPFSREKLINAVDAAVESLDQRLNGRGDNLKHIELSHALSNTIEQLLFRAIKLNSEIDDFIPYLKTTLNFKTARGCIGILEWGREQPDSAVDMGRNVISRLKYKFPCLASAFKPEILFFFPETSEGKSIPDIQHMAALLEQENSSPAHWRFGVGKCVEFEKINESYLEARQKIRGEAETFDAGQLLSYAEQWRRRLEPSIQNNHIEQIREIFSEVVQRTETSIVAEAVLCEIFLYVEHMNSVYTGFHLHRYVTEDTFRSRAVTVEELSDFFSGWAYALADKMKTVQKENLPNILRRALDFINLNYSYPLQLTDVAKQVEVSSAYLSHLFSSHLRKSFVDQLTQIRLDKAKQLLKEHAYSIKEVSSMVGYQDPNYFSRLFKRFTGCSPSEFG